MKTCNTKRFIKQYLSIYLWGFYAKANVHLNKVVQHYSGQHLQNLCVIFRTIISKQVFRQVVALLTNYRLSN